MTRYEKVRFCQQSVWEFEGVETSYDYWNTLTDEELDSQVEFYDYLWDK